MLRFVAVAMLSLVSSGVAYAQGLDDPIEACDVPEIRFAMALDEPDWEVACDGGVVGAVRVGVAAGGEVVATLAWRGRRLEGRVALGAILGREEGDPYSQLIDVRFLPVRAGYRRLSIVSQAGEDTATRLEHQVWFQLRRGGWVVAFAGRADGSVHVNGTCEHTWRTSFAVRERALRRRWRYARRYDGDADGERACAEYGGPLAPRSVRLRRLTLEPRSEDDSSPIPSDSR